MISFWRSERRSMEVPVTGRTSKARGRLMSMSQGRRTSVEEVEELDSEDRAWLEERLKEYRELLAYLRDH